MPRFCVLASGSSGNAAFLQSAGFGLLIDAGIGPRMISSRLATIGASWKHINAAVLTHVHADHWKDRTLAQLRANGIPLHCHETHAQILAIHSPSFASLQTAGLVRVYQSDGPVEFPYGLRCLPIEVPHDSEATFAFRFNGSAGLFDCEWSLGYAADLGIVPDRLIEAFADVQLLALEFNHDVDMERRSGRPAHLIERVLGDQGHLSNRQAADSLRRLAESSCNFQLKQIVQLHLSHQCNRPALAAATAEKILHQHKHKIGVYTAMQDRSSAVFEVGI